MKPTIFMATRACRGSNKGVPMCDLKVSLTNACGNRVMMSDSSIGLALQIVCSNSKQDFDKFL